MSSPTTNNDLISLTTEWQEVDTYDSWLLLQAQNAEEFYVYVGTTAPLTTDVGIRTTDFSISSLLGKKVWVRTGNSSGATLAYLPQY